MVILEGIWNACIIIGVIILITLFLWALITVVIIAVKAFGDFVRWWKNSWAQTH